MPKIAEILSQPDGMPVTGLVAVVTKAYEPKKGEGTNGPWCSMGITLKDDTGEIAATWWDPSIPHTQLKGQTVYVGARQNSKKQLSGVKVGSYHSDKLKIQIKTLSISGNHLSVDKSGDGVAFAEVPNDPIPDGGWNPPYFDKAKTGVSPTPGPAPVRASGGNVARPGGLSESDLLAFLDRAIPEVSKILNQSKVPTTAEAVAAIVNTLVIAATNGRFTLAGPEGTESQSDEAYWAGLGGS